ncbi:MAG TPA: tRNA preQ1(34) S-adenosylmethionine ribosyltransferase-isomerase QueA [Firmicutes bacterium]|jgi:S-adenosylmethionine:tRNA ribosyltransferase-isomerase|nr:tRNA preQ1(34) S-adenosylmethionine ribosyltransferase-isomerase QueA [Bacillota bacterium]HHT42347.1 tRNA preQ1(34) S-adenosylmethionine ribosyltransferase-isomerase QueA [Bacillota bacterium]
MRVEEFDFDLPLELIAQKPLASRDASRLLVVKRGSGECVDGKFSDLPLYLRPSDVLVINDSRVLPARLWGQNPQKSGLVEILLLRPHGEGKWEVLVRPGKKARVGAEIVFSPRLSCTVLDTTPNGTRLVQFHFEGDFQGILEELGETPLPPYIHEKLDDPERYQTVYAKHSGSVAAPTAGLHFTPQLLDAIDRLGVAVVPVTLHVGLGTFRPVQTEHVEDHVMHEEYYELSPEDAAVINARREAGGRVIAVGTTSVRVLETLADEQGRVHAGSGWTDIFIYPGYKFQVVDGMVTNFHLPKSSLLMLVSAFAGREVIRHAYEHAVAKRYRFFSFGDGMLLL